MIPCYSMAKLSTISFIALLLLSSCSHKINRIGYDTQIKEKEDCFVIFQKDGNLPYKDIRKIGEIELKDTGFSSKCNEDDAIKLLKQESCMLGANLVNIVHEERTDRKSTCYRCTAELLLVENDCLLNSLQNSPDYKPTSLEKRLAEDKKKNKSQLLGTIIGAVVGGIIGGLVASSV